MEYCSLINGRNCVLKGDTPDEAFQDERKHKKPLLKDPFFLDKAKAA